MFKDLLVLENRVDWYFHALEVSVSFLGDLSAPLLDILLAVSAVVATFHPLSFFLSQIENGVDEDEMISSRNVLLQVSCQLSRLIVFNKIQVRLHLASLDILPID